MLDRDPPHFCGPRQVVAKRIRRNADAIFNHRAMASEREFEWAMVANVSGETEATKSFAHPQDWRPLLGLRFENFARVWAEGQQQLCSTRKKITGIARQQALLTPMLFHARLQSFRGVFYQRPLLRLYFKDLGSGRGSGSQPRARVEA